MRTYPSPARPDQAALGVLELRQLLELVLGRPRQHDLAAVVLQVQALERDGHEAAAEPEEAADLEHREQDAVAADDDVVDRADLLVLVVDDVAALELAGAVALGDGRHVDHDEVDRRLRERGSRAGREQRRHGQHGGRREAGEWSHARSRSWVGMPPMMAGRSAAAMIPVSFPAARAGGP